MSETIFGANLNKALAHKGISPETCAARCRIPQHEFDLYTKGVCFPDAATLGKIADALGVRVKDLAGDMPLEYTTFGEELRALREAAGINRAEMSELTGIPYKSLCNYERGASKKVSEANFEKLKETLGGDFVTLVKKYEVNGKAKRTHSVKTIRPAKTAEELTEAKRLAEKTAADRKAANLSREAYAEKIGVSATTVFRMESGEYCPVDFKPCDTVSQQKPKLKADFFKLLDFIDDDKEYREAVKELIRWGFEGGELRPVNRPQADLIFKMIVK